MRVAHRARHRRRTPRSTTFATGCSARRRATGSRWVFPPMAHTASRRESSPATRAAAAAGSGRSSRGSRSRSSRAAGSTPVPPSCARSATRSALWVSSKGLKPNTARKSRPLGGRLFRTSQFLFGGVVLATLLPDPALFLEFTEDAVEVVGFDLHRFRDLRGADPRVFLHQGDRLVGPSSTAAPPAFARSRAGRRGFGRSTWAAAASTRTSRTAGDGAAELTQRSLEALALLVELGEPFLDEV